MPGGCLRKAVTDDDDDIVKAKQADRRVWESNFLEQQSEAACPVGHISSFKGNTSDLLSSRQCTLHCALCICALKQQSEAACPVLSRTSALIYFAHLHFYNKVKFTLETCVLCICSLEQQSEAAYIVLSCKSALFKGKYF